MREYLAYSSLIVLVYCMTGANSQFGPVPQRFVIPAGPVQSQVRQPIQYRNERLVGGGPGPNGGFLRARRPVLAAPVPYVSPNSLGDEAKPVTEENESAEGNPFITQQPLQQIHQVHTLQQQPQQQQQHQSLPAVLYTTDENGQVLNQQRPHIEFPNTPRFIQQSSPEIVPTTIRTTGGSPRFALSHDHPIQSALQGTTKPPQLRAARPEYREPRPNFEAKELAQPVRRPQFDYVNAKPRQHHEQEERDKKPVAQILRKYREENEDGTITWGFENDDGSFKEEIIGNDCITRGRYGYVDPDGVKREYNYETGIACDPNKRDLEEPEENEEPENQATLQDNGAYIDYQENQMVLPNGQRISLNSAAKNKGRRPNYGQ